MKNAKTTKRSLLLSILSLLLCFAMLTTTTFAWFTDSVTSGKNTIVAGNLDVELYHTSASTQAEEKVDGVTDLFVDAEGNPILWEPGVVTYETFTVKNVGTLALVYELSMKVGDHNTVDEHSLAEFLKVAVIEGATTFADREAAIAAAEGNLATLADFTQTGYLKPVDGNVEKDPYKDYQAEESFTVVVYWEPTDHDNDVNVNNGKTVSDYDENDPESNKLYIDLGITLEATQTPYESDSFDELYDEKAMPTKVGTLEELQNAVAAGGNIQLTDSIKYKATSNYFGNPPFTVAKDSTVDIDLNGNTFEIDSPDGKSGIKGNEGATLTLSNGTVTGNKAWGSSYPILDANKGTLILDGMTVALEASADVAVSAGSDGGKLIIKNSTITGPDTKYSNAVFVGSKAEAEITDSTINGSLYVGTNGTMVIENTTVNGTNHNISGKLTIKSGKFKTKPETKWLAAGSTISATQDADGYWVVTAN